MHRRRGLFALVFLCVLLLVVIANSWAQSNTASLAGVITDPQGLAVVGAKVTATSLATGAVKTATSDGAGHYVIPALPPGEYKLRIEGGTNFAPYENSALKVTVGEEAIVNVKLELGTQTQVVTVTTESAPIETTRSESAQTVEQRQINNLPINGRSYINFTLTNSQTTRDNAPTIGPAPNSGLNISGARARSNMVSVDGADFSDNSVDGIRSTVSQEAVQEFQMILSNYNAEYGRATGGVVNIVTKSGTNDFHGSVFGFLRNTAFQARNPFSGQVNQTTGQLEPIKQAYTRVQAGLTFGGALKKNKTFYFFSYEYTQREETGFSSIGEGNFGLTSGDIPCIGNPATGQPIPLTMTPSQLTFYQQNLGALSQATGGTCTSANPALQKKITGLQTAAVVTGASSNVAINGDLNKNVGGATVPISTALLGIPAALGSNYFPQSVACPAGGPQINQVICNPLTGDGLAPLPSSYVPLNNLRGNFPTQEKTSLWSARLDQQWNSRNHSFLRIGVSPSYVTGIQTTAQNQVLGQNAASRVGVNWLHDFNATFQHDTIVSDAAYNEFRFQFARRSNYFGYSSQPGGAALGVNIPGYAYFGREPYSTVNRIERRYEFTDNVTWTHGRHTFKVGGDVNLIQLRSSQAQIFELDFGGVANFGGFNPFPAPVPGVNPLQGYGLGDPIYMIQGIGASSSPFDNLPFALFAQDSWRVTRKLTVNYGLRYDVEITPLFAPATQINATAEKALGVIEGIPRDYHNVAPRIGLAYDPKGDGRMVVRAGYGLFYDHPLLAVAFNATTADGARSVQLISPGGQASACGVVTPATAPAGYPLCNNGLDSPLNFNGSSIFQGVLNALPSMYYQTPGNSQRFDPLQTNSVFANQNYLTAGLPLTALPFTLPVTKNFQYGYAQQANLTVEKQFGSDWTLSVGYQWTRGLHLYRPVDVNPTNPRLLATNFQNANAAGLGFTSPLSVAVQDVQPVLGSTCGLTTAQPGLVPGVLGVLYGCPDPTFDGKFVGTAAYFNNFRPSGPNPSFAVATGEQIPQCAGNLFSCGFAAQQQLAAAAGYPVGFGTLGSTPVPMSSVDAQSSIGTSSYNALTVNLRKRFSHNFELLSSYTYSHSIDDSTDLQSTLEPQDSRFPWLDRANSVNDQRHRWVTSGVWQSAPAKSGDSFWKHLGSNVTLAPIIEVASGRPFNVITGSDTRLDGNSSVIRPSFGGSTSSPYIHGVTFGVPATCLQNDGQTFAIPGVTTSPFGYGCFGNLGRDKFTMPFFYQFDMRFAKAINLGERFQLQLIADAFNLFNHTNIIAVNQLCDPSAGRVCTAGQPTAASDARVFQFALKLSW